MEEVILKEQKAAQDMKAIRQQKLKQRQDLPAPQNQLEEEKQADENPNPNGLFSFDYEMDQNIDNFQNNQNEHLNEERRRSSIRIKNPQDMSYSYHSVG